MADRSGLAEAGVVGHDLLPDRREEGWARRELEPDRLVCHFTPYGEEMYERFGKDELPDTSSWAALRGKPPKKGRTYTPNSERMSLEEFFGVTGDMPSNEKEA